MTAVVGNCMHEKVVGTWDLAPVGLIGMLCLFWSDVIDLSRERTRLLVVVDGLACVGIFFSRRRR